MVFGVGNDHIFLGVDTQVLRPVQCGFQRVAIIAAQTLLTRSHHRTNAPVQSNGPQHVCITFKNENDAARITPRTRRPNHFPAAAEAFPFVRRPAVGVEIDCLGSDCLGIDGVKADRWRILVGKDADRLDSMVRQDPESAYEPEFFQKLAAAPPHGLGAEIWEVKAGQRTRKLSGADLFAD